VADYAVLVQDKCEPKQPAAYYQRTDGVAVPRRRPTLRAAMNMTFATHSHAILIGFALASLSFGQDKSGLRVDSKWVLAPVMFEEDYYRAAQKHVEEGTFDVRAKAVLQSAEAFTKDIFTFTKLDLQKASTYTHYFIGPESDCPSNQDTLMAEWSVDGPAGAGTLILEDNPIESIYMMRGPAHLIVTRADLTAFLRQILVDEKPPLRIGLSWWDFWVPPGPTIPAFGAHTTGSPNPFIAEISVDGVSRGTDAYLCVRVTKNYAEKYYHLPPLVPERFPPLAEMAKEWSIERVLSETGRSWCPVLQQFLTNKRNQVLFEELIKRDPTKEQFLQILTEAGDGSSRALMLRARDVMYGIVVAKRETLLRRYFGAALEAYSAMGGRGDDAAGELFRMANADCSAEYEAVTLRSLEGRYAKWSIGYLGTCSSSEETLGILEGLSFTGEAKAALDLNIQRIRTRIGSQPKRR